MDPTCALRLFLLEPSSTPPACDPTCASSPADLPDADLPVAERLDADSPELEHRVADYLALEYVEIEGIFPQAPELEAFWSLEPLVLEALADEDEPEAGDSESLERGTAAHPCLEAHS